MMEITNVASLAEAYDLVIVGAGPAGMSAALAASRFGRKILVVDENPRPGGQIYRGVSASPVQDQAILGEDYWKGAALCRAFLQSAVDVAPRATLWSIGAPLAESDGAVEIGVSLRGAARTVLARHVILATGALERPFPIPGWTLPGVLTAGAAQIALKTSGLVPEGRVVLAGCGPLLYLLGAQLLAAGARIVAVVDTTDRQNWWRAAAQLPTFLASPYAGKGLKLLAQTFRGLRFVRGATGLRVEGDGRVERLVVQRARGTVMLDCDMVLLHQGVIPNINVSNAIGCAHRFDSEAHCWTPVVDAWFTSSLPHVSIAGDGAGIGGAESAALRGSLAALAAAHRLGWINEADRDHETAALSPKLSKSLRGRRFLDILYRPARAFLDPDDPATIACRCEEVTVGQIRDTTLALNVTGPNQLKTFLRCGMGPCQGRLCGPTVTEVMANARHVSHESLGTYRLRPPFKPITVAEIASLPKTEAALTAVVR